MTETMTYTSLDQLPVAVQAEDIAAVLGISRAGAYTLMRSKGFPTIYVGKRRMIVMRDKFSSHGWMSRHPDTKKSPPAKSFSAGGGTGYFNFWRRDL